MNPQARSLISDGLIRALQKYTAGEIVGKAFTPKMLLPSWFTGIWGMRFARVYSISLSAPTSRRSITHLLDHGYAHFLYFRKPDNTVVTVTDLMPILWWKGLLPVKTKKGIPVTVLYSLYALKRAAHIITISANTKNDLVKLIGCDPSKISVFILALMKFSGRMIQR